MLEESLSRVDGTLATSVHPGVRAGTRSWPTPSFLALRSELAAHAAVSLRLYGPRGTEQWPHEPMIAWKPDRAPHTEGPELNPARGPVHSGPPPVVSKLVVPGSRGALV